MTFVFSASGEKKGEWVPVQDNAVVTGSSERPTTLPELLSCSLQSRDLLRVRSKHIRKFCLSQFQFSTTKGKTSHHSIERGNNGDPPLALLSRTGRIRTCNQGIMRTDYGFRRPFRVCGLDHTFTRIRISQYHPAVAILGER